MSIPAFICLGSNAVNAQAILEAAASRIALLPGCHLAARSKIYLTEPQGYSAQPWFHNQALKLMVGENAQPAQLLRQLLTIESQLGRVRSGPRFGPRQIDIDLLLFGEIKSDLPDCILPHPRLVERAFALVPLLELAPDIVVNGDRGDCWLRALDWRIEGNKIFQ